LVWFVDDGDAIAVHLLGTAEMVNDGQSYLHLHTVGAELDRTLLGMQKGR
jgi:hypothetical protein